MASTSRRSSSSSRSRPRAHAHAVNLHLEVNSWINRSLDAAGKHCGTCLAAMLKRVGHMTSCMVAAADTINLVLVPLYCKMYSLLSLTLLRLVFSDTKNNCVC
jgi:hypothetical protein